MPYCHCAEISISLLSGSLPHVWVLDLHHHISIDIVVVFPQPLLVIIRISADIFQWPFDKLNWVSILTR